jgi:hypothetical protein
LVNDKRLNDRWSDDTVLPLVNFALCSHETPETGGYTPFQLKYGTQDAEYFRLPANLSPGARAGEMLRRLDRDLEIIREISIEKQAEIVQERKKNDKPHTTYAVGDYVLWNPREEQSDFNPAGKLGPNWFGPYEVIQQVKNDVTMKHMCIHTVEVQHVSRLKPFFGSREDALNMAKLDYNQYDIVRFNYFTGNPHKRSSMLFNVTFAYNGITEDKMVPYSADLDRTQQFEEYINSNPILFPLRYHAKESIKQINNMNRQAITRVVPMDTVYLNLRYFDGTNSAWFDSLDLPEKNKTYSVMIRVLNWENRLHTKLKAYCEVFDLNVLLTTYDIHALTITEEDFDEEKYILVTVNMQRQYPKMFE